MGYDLVIRNGTVVDGSGRGRFRADVGVIGDRIAAVGRIRESGRTEIDAEGKIVAPGFIECHSHMDAQIFWDQLGTCPAWHGVTTTMMGNCGFTLAPCRESEAELCLRSLERSEDISRDAMLQGIKWSWETYPEYLDVIDSLPKGINYASFIGHGAIRSYVMGERSFEAEATEDEIAAMRGHVESGMKAGAIGFSSSFNSAHMTSDNKPTASRMAHWDETRALVDVMRELGTGIFELSPEVFGGGAMRDVTKARLRQVALESGRPTTFIIAANHILFPDLWTEMLELSEDVAAHGGHIICQVNCRPMQGILSFQTSLPFENLPSWKAVRSRTLAEQRAALLDPDIRKALVSEAMNGPYARTTVGAEPKPPQWDALCILESVSGSNRSTAELARQKGVTPADIMIDLALETDLKQFFVQTYANQTFDLVMTQLNHPHCVVGGQDSGAHVSQIIETSAPTYMMSRLVRTEKLLTLEQAVRKLTFDQAWTWGIPERGLIGQGMIADLVVFDSETIAPDLPVLVRDLPGGGKRLKQTASGIAATVVGGEILLRDGVHTGALPGRLVRGPLAGQYRNSSNVN